MGGGARAGRGADGGDLMALARLPAPIANLPWRVLWVVLGSPASDCSSFIRPPAAT